MVSSKGNSCAQIEFFYSCVVAAYRCLSLSIPLVMYIYISRTHTQTHTLVEDSSSAFLFANVENCS